MVLSACGPEFNNGWKTAPEDGLKSTCQVVTIFRPVRSLKCKTCDFFLWLKLMPKATVWQAEATSISCSHGSWSSENVGTGELQHPAGQNCWIWSIRPSAPWSVNRRPFIVEEGSGAMIWDFEVRMPPLSYFAKKSRFLDEPTDILPFCFLTCTCFVRYVRRPVCWNQTGRFVERYDGKFSWLILDREFVLLYTTMSSYI